MNDTFAAARFLVVAGSSLRDTHLVNAITYRNTTLVVLVVGRSAGTAASRLRGMRTVTLEADTNDFLRLTVPLEGLWDQIDHEAHDIASLHALVEAWAREQERTIAAWHEMTPALQAAVDGLKAGSPGQKLAALGALRGSHAAAVSSAEIVALRDEEAAVRSAAAANLGIAGDSGAVSGLCDLAVGDPVPLVRLEAALALRRIGGPVAEEALRIRHESSPGDEFIELALAASST